MAPLDLLSRSRLLLDWGITGSAGASHLANAIVDPIMNASPSVLTLAIKDKDGDTIRPYLEEKANFEGKSGKKAWSKIRTVRDNLLLMFVDQANKQNAVNAERIKARELREEDEARDKGCSVEALPPRVRYNDECWRDGKTDFEEFLARCAVYEKEQIIRYDIPESVADRLIAWKRMIRKTKGGIKGVLTLTRGQVIPEPVKRKFPKKQK